MTPTEEKETSILLENRSRITLSGIEDVIRFDDVCVDLVTGNGNLLIEGTDLHITALDVASGKMTVEGKIDSAIYHEQSERKKGGLFSRGR